MGNIVVINDITERYCEYTENLAITIYQVDKQRQEFSYTLKGDLSLYERHEVVTLEKRAVMLEDIYKSAWSELYEITRDTNFSDGLSAAHSFTMECMNASISWAQTMVETNSLKVA